MKRYFIFLTLFVSAGCQLFTPKPSLLDDLACPPPCWQNIVPGISTKQDALSTLAQLAFIDQKSIYAYDPKLVPPKGTPIQVYDEIIDSNIASDGQFYSFLSIYLLKDKVSVISFQLRIYDITLSEAITKLGEPESIVISPYRENLVFGFVSPSVGVAFVYSTLGQSKKALSEVYPDARLESIYFFDPETYAQFLESRFLTFNQRDSDGTRAHLVPWKGYGAIKELYPPKAP